MVKIVAWRWGLEGWLGVACPEVAVGASGSYKDSATCRTLCAGCL